MKKHLKPAVFLVLLLFGLLNINRSDASVIQKGDTLSLPLFIKKEIHSGIFFNSSSEREELNTDISKKKEDLFSGVASYQFGGKVWNFLEYKQEMMDLVFNVGPFFGSGNWADSSKVMEIDGTLENYGLRLNLAGNYETRFYYDQKSYTLIKLNGWVKNELYLNNSEGTKTDSNHVTTVFDDSKIDNKFRYGFQARAGWGFGRLNPVNHVMVAEYLLESSYPGRIFSEVEMKHFASKIGEIKHRRDPGMSRSARQELAEIADYLRTKMLLAAPEIDEELWMLGEFAPRLQGTRFEIGPFFNYFNYEPDFYYGGFAQFENARYINRKWNRNFSMNLNYSHYKKHEWATLETNLGWNYYPNLKTQYSFGLKYIPGMVIYGLNDFDPVRHNFIPYVEYFTQVNAKTRVNLSFAWNLGDGEDFMMTGPNFSLAIYRSRY